MFGHFVSLFQVITDKTDYHSPDSIFPIGYCSTRVYASITDPNKRCLYTCKISDTGEAPLVGFTLCQIIFIASVS